MLDAPSFRRNRRIAIGGLVGVEHQIDGGVADGVRGDAPASLVECPYELDVRPARKRLQPAIRATSAPGLLVGLPHPSALETAVDDDLDPAHAQPLVALVLFRAESGELCIEIVGRRHAQQRVYAHAEQPAFRHLAKDAQHLGRDSRIADASEPRFVQSAIFRRQVLDGLFAIDAGRRRQRHEVPRAVHELAIEAAVFVPPDAAAVRLWRPLSNPPLCKRRGVEDVLVAAAHHDQRMIRRGAIEIIAIWKPLFLELSFVPVAVRHDHLTGRRGRRAHANGGEHVVDRAGARQIHAWAAADAVEMIV